MEIPSSLRALCDTYLSNSTGSLTPPHCVPLCETFWKFAVGTDSGSTGSHIGLDEAYEQCLSVGEGAARCDGFDELLRQARRGVVGESDFPGPMCSPLTRLDLRKVTPKTYTFTEKSDGIRTILVLRTCHRFPLWKSQSGLLVSAHVSVVARLESARRRLMQAPSEPQRVEAVILEDGKSELCLSLTRASSGEGTEEQFCGVLRHWHEDTVKESDVVLSRSVGRMPLCFALDRGMHNFYVLCEGPAQLHAEAAVFDGELMTTCEQDRETQIPLAQQPPPFVLGLFDVFSYLPVGGEADDAALVLGARSMAERYGVLQGLISDTPALTTPGSTVPDSCCRPRTISWFVKTMWRIEQFEDCLGRLHFDARGHFYVYHDRAHGWCTRNDGFILTPDEFPVVSGASPVQFKWKWKRSLSVDWLVRATRPGGDLYDMSLFFRKKRFNHQPDTCGHWKLPHPWTLRNPHGFVISTRPSEASVVECIYDPQSKQWVMERLRQDKSQANSITTAISVLESLAENLTLVHLLKALGVSSDVALERAAALDTTTTTTTTPGAAPQQVSDKTAVAPAGKRSAKNALALTAPFNARAVTAPDGERNFYLYWCTSSTGNPEFKRTIPAPLCRVRDCVGLGSDAALADKVGVNSQLETVLSIELANAGGSCAWSDFVVDACFNGQTGRWEVIRMRPHGKAQMASFDHTVEHLRTVIELGGGDNARRAIPASALEVPRSLGLIANASRDAKTALTNEHYATKARELSSQSGERSMLRRFHNWIKSILLSQVVASAQTRFHGHLYVLDICCGRGGDLHKWKASRPNFLFMTDASAECVAEAASRYNVSEGMSLKTAKDRLPGFPAFFAVYDAFDPSSMLREELLKVRRERGRGFAIASCQFSMHYACHSLERIACFVETVSASLNPGGLFTGTTLNDATVFKMYAEKGSHFESGAYGMRFPRETVAKFDEHAAALSNGACADPLPFGLEYYITIEDTVSDLPEYVVPWEPFVQLCASFSLTLVKDTDFASFYDAEKDSDEGRKLREVILRKRTHDGSPLEFELSPSQKEAAALYRAFIFEKKAV